MKGFTILEIIIVLALIVLVGLLVWSIGINFWQNQKLDEVSVSILDSLRTARNQAVFQKNDSGFGIKFFDDHHILFQGPSYNQRYQNNDQLFNFPRGFTISGLNEIVFSKLTGIPSSTSTINIAFGNLVKKIKINDYGFAEFEQ